MVSTKRTWSTQDVRLEPCSEWFRKRPCRPVLLPNQGCSGFVCRNECRSLCTNYVSLCPPAHHLRPQPKLINLSDSLSSSQTVSSWICAISISPSGPSFLALFSLSSAAAECRTLRINLTIACCKLDFFFPHFEFDSHPFISFFFCDLL